MTSILHSATSGDLWLEAMKKVYLKGHNIKDGEQVLKELLSVVVKVDNPTVIDNNIKKYGDITMIEWMKNNFLFLKPIENWSYSYGQRMYDFNGYNQINKIV